MMIFTLLLFMLSSCVVFSKDAHHHTSIESLYLLLDCDEVIAQLMQKRLNATNDQSLLEKLENYIKTSEKFYLNKRANEELFYHPIDAFHFLKHTVYDYAGIPDALKKENSTSSVSLLKDITHLRKVFKFPNATNILKAAASISRMQKFYRLPVRQLILGKIEDKASGKVFQSLDPLNSWDCNEIAKGAAELNLFNQSLSWFGLALKTVKHDPSIKMKTVLDDKKLAEHKSSSYVPPSVNSESRYTFKEFAEKATVPKEEYYVRYNIHRVLEPMARLCRGKKLKLNVPKRSYSCKYFTGGHLYLKIRPLKMEEVSEKPAIVIYHDFMTDEEMEDFMITALPQLKPSTHIPVTDYDRKFTVTLERTSKQSFVCGTKAGVEIPLARRIEAATGLQVLSPNATECFQVVNYGIGGMYTPHSDYFGYYGGKRDTKLHNVGDRMATILFYMGNVTLGGSTVFPFAGVSIPFERGAAVFWHNTFKNGGGDMLTAHGGCPVVYGSKWIVNAWVHSHSQMFNAPCTKGILDRFTF